MNNEEWWSEDRINSCCQKHVSNRAWMSMEEEILRLKEEIASLKSIIDDMGYESIERIDRPEDF